MLTEMEFHLELFLARIQKKAPTLPEEARTMNMQDIEDGEVRKKRFKNFKKI